MLNKFLVLIVLVSLNTCFLSGQTIHYDYDESGNQVKRYIILNKGNASGDDTSKKIVENSKPEEIVENSKPEEFEDKLGELTIKIYPNPTLGQLFVEIKGLGSDETVDYQLFSQTGLNLEVKKKIGYQFTVDMERYPGGLYILRLMISGKTSQWKILKE